MNATQAATTQANAGRIFDQKKQTPRRTFTKGGQKYDIRATMRFDDECRNGHETFSITAEIYRVSANGARSWDSGGCLHDEIAKYFPDLAPLIKWHLTSTDGPMHYVANTLYHAGDRDHNGLRAGESRQLRNGKTGEPCWVLQAIGPDGAATSTRLIKEYADGATPPANTLTLEWRPWLRVGEGKARDLAAARSCAVWPDATDAELMQEPEALKAALLARLPALQAEFKAAMIGAGFRWPGEDI